jgi:hypothetical protein
MFRYEEDQQYDSLNQHIKEEMNTSKTMKCHLDKNLAGT